MDVEKTTKAPVGALEHFNPIDHYNAIYSIIIPFIIPLIMNTIITIYYNIL